MEYREIITDFTQRSRENLEYLELQHEKHGAPVYPVTQLWNSLLGLIVLPRERDVSSIKQLPMTDLWAQGWPRLRVTVGTEPRNVNQFLRLLRNAVAHFNVEFRADDKTKQIWEVEIWNTPTGSKERNWEARISVTDLRALAFCVADLYEQMFSTRAA